MLLLCCDIVMLCCVDVLLRCCGGVLLTQGIVYNNQGSAIWIPESAIILFIRHRNPPSVRITRILV